MANLIALLTALMPMISPLIQALLVKPKKQAASDLREGAKAHLAQKQTAAAWWLGTLACAIESMDDAAWASMPKALEGVQNFAASQKGGAA